MWTQTHNAPHMQWPCAPRSEVHALIYLCSAMWKHLKDLWMMINFSLLFVFVFFLAHKCKCLFKDCPLSPVYVRLYANNVYNLCCSCDAHNKTASFAPSCESCRRAPPGGAARSLQTDTAAPCLASVGAAAASSIPRFSARERISEAPKVRTGGWCSPRETRPFTEMMLSGTSVGAVNVNAWCWGSVLVADEPSVWCWLDGWMVSVVWRRLALPGEGCRRVCGGLP